VHQAILKQDPALEAVPAPAVRAARPRTNLPDSFTELIGRSEATAEVRALVETGRLVTLTGSGGFPRSPPGARAVRRPVSSSGKPCRISPWVSSLTRSTMPGGASDSLLIGLRPPAAATREVAAEGAV
jgi:hypothetical protein